MTRKRFDPELTKRFIRRVPLFGGFSDQELTQLLERTSIRSYQKDEIIILGNDKNDQMFIILSGRVKVVDLTDCGEERVMAFRQRGDYFGEMYFLDGETDSATVIALEPCRILLIAKSVFEEFFMKNNMALVQVISVLCRRLRECWIFHDIIGTYDAETKIRATLAHYSKTLGHPDSDGVIISSVFSHQVIADRIHIKRETVTRVLKKMKEQDEIEMVGRHMKLLPNFFEKFRETKFFKPDE